MNSKNNRSVRRTKAALSRAFLELASVKPVRSITVAELVEASDVSRGTFYVHYHDIYDLVDTIGDELVEEMERRLEGVRACGTPGATGMAGHDFPRLTEMCRFVAEESRAFKVLLGIEGNERFRQRLTDLCSSATRAAVEEAYGKLPPDASEAFEQFVTSGYLGMLSAVLRKGSFADPDTTAMMAGRMVAGTAQALMAGASEEGMRGQSATSA